MTMTIFIKTDDLQEFRQIVKNNNVRHGPFRLRMLQNKLGYYVDILDPGPMETFLTLKFG